MAFAAGSSGIAFVKEIGLHGRWVALFALALAAAPFARYLRRLPRASTFAAIGFVSLALLSTLWSAAPATSAGRALSIALLFGTAALIAAGSQADAATAQHVLHGLLGGAVAVAILGVVVLGVAYATAVEPASIEAPPRYRGFGEDPNTVSLLLALALPIALVWGLATRDRKSRFAATAVVMLFAASIVGSASRGALLGAAVGTAAALAVMLRGRQLALAAVALITAIGAAGVLQSLPDAASAPAAAAAAASSPSEASSRYVDVERVYPLDNDVGRPLPGRGEPDVQRSFFGTSGRTAAWRGALERVAERPVLGFGFGTEGRAFVDRYYAFVGGLPESSYIGIALQLGVVGLGLLVALVALLLAGGRAALRRGTPTWAAACAGVVAGGLAIALVQSYVYSVGNVGAATFWIAAFLLPALGPREPV